MKPSVNFIDFARAARSSGDDDLVTLGTGFHDESEDTVAGTTDGDPHLCLARRTGGTQMKHRRKTMNQFLKCHPQSIAKENREQIPSFYPPCDLLEYRTREFTGNHNISGRKTEGTALCKIERSELRHPVQELLRLIHPYPPR